MNTAGVWFSRDMNLWVMAGKKKSGKRRETHVHTAETFSVVARLYKTLITDNKCLVCLERRHSKKVPDAR